MDEKVYNEKWKAGKCGGAIVSNTPNHTATDDSVEYYGGYLVAESVGSEKHMRLIIAAPELLKACQFALSVQKSQGVIDISEKLNVKRLEAAIRLARFGVMPEPPTIEPDENPDDEDFETAYREEII